MAKGDFQIPSLDGLRAVSFLLVFVAHAGLGSVVPGGFGVTVFFFLSGFLITTLMRRELDQRGALSLKQFYLRQYRESVRYSVQGLALAFAIFQLVEKPFGRLRRRFSGREPRLAPVEAAS